jgi:periplasmic protein TonB
MRDPLSRDFSALQPSQDSWLHRVRDNFRQLLTPTRIFPSSANGAPIHVLKLDMSMRRGRAQSFSFLTHAAIISTLVLLAAHPPGGAKNNFLPGKPSLQPIPLPKSLLDRLRSNRPSNGRGAGGDQNQIPATRGNLVPVSSIQTVRPSLPPKRETQLPVPPTILDPKAAATLSPTDHPGLPWMKDFNESPGPGKGHTIGSRDGETMGDSKDGPGGRGESEVPYHPGTTLPSCAYCPDPQYTDEAREAKMQGKVTLRVLVGADGRAAEIRIVQGIGMGLDERAEQAIRGWKFVPARDAARRAVPQWVTVEAVFRLF